MSACWCAVNEKMSAFIKRSENCEARDPSQNSVSVPDWVFPSMPSLEFPQSESRYSEKGSTAWKRQFKKLEIPELAALKPKTEKSGPIRKKFGVLIRTNRMLVKQPSVDWFDVADWDNDGGLDLLVNTRQHRCLYPNSGHIQAAGEPGIRNVLPTCGVCSGSPTMGLKASPNSNCPNCCLRLGTSQSVFR